MTIDDSDKTMKENPIRNAEFLPSAVKYVPSLRQMIGAASNHADPMNRNPNVSPEICLTTGRSVDTNRRVQPAKPIEPQISIESNARASSSRNDLCNSAASDGT